MKTRYRLLPALISIFLAACSTGENEQGPSQKEGKHVWKEQTDPIEKAKGVEQLIQDSTGQRHRVIEEQGG